MNISDFWVVFVSFSAALIVAFRVVVLIISMHNCLYTHSQLRTEAL